MGELYTPAELEAAAQANAALWGLPAPKGGDYDTARAVLDAAAPLIAARTRAAVAEEIALHLLSRRPHIPPSTHPDRKVAVAMRDTLNRSARWARQHATPPTEEDTDADPA